MSTCIVCGHPDGACTGKEREIVTVSGVVTTGARMRVPKQNVRVGRAGYQGNVEVYDPKYPKLRMVTPDADVAIDTEISGDGSGEALPPIDATATEERTSPAVRPSVAPKKKPKAKE